MTTDITNCKKAEAELENAKNYLETIIKTSYDGIFVVDAEGLFEFGNDAFLKISGYPENEIIGQSFMMAIHLDKHDFILERWNEVQKRDGKPYEVEIVRKDGTVRCLLVSHAKMELGMDTKYCVVVKDITQHKQDEAEVHRLNEELEQRVKERTAQLDEAIAEQDRRINLFIKRELTIPELRARIAKLEAEIEFMKHDRHYVKAG